MKNTPLTTAIITQEILSLLERCWKPCSNWWEKCTHTHELYLVYLDIARKQPGIIVAQCSGCGIKFLLDSRSWKNPHFCIFGCRQDRREERNRQAKKQQRKRDRNRDTFASNKFVAPTLQPPILEPGTPITSQCSNSELMDKINSLFLIDLTTSAILLISAIHPSLSKDTAKLFGIIAFMSAGIKFTDQAPDWLVGIDEQVLMEVINGIEDG